MFIFILQYSSASAIYQILLLSSSETTLPEPCPSIPRPSTATTITTLSGALRGTLRGTLTLTSREITPTTCPANLHISPTSLSTHLLNTSSNGRVVVVNRTVPFLRNPVIQAIVIPTGVHLLRNTSSSSRHTGDQVLIEDNTHFNHSRDPQ